MNKRWVCLAIVLSAILLVELRADGQETAPPPRATTGEPKTDASKSTPAATKTSSDRAQQLFKDAARFAKTYAGGVEDDMYNQVLGHLLLMGSRGLGVAYPPPGAVSQPSTDSLPSAGPT